MRISAGVQPCALPISAGQRRAAEQRLPREQHEGGALQVRRARAEGADDLHQAPGARQADARRPQRGRDAELVGEGQGDLLRSEEHTSELQSLMRISYAVFCLKKKKTQRVKKLNRS